MLLGSFLMII